MRLAPGEEIRIVDQGAFDDLGIAGADLARRERVEAGRVDQHERGLVEGADEILARRRVDRGLAADRGVDLREQAGRHLHEIAAALQDGGGKADQVADHAAAKSDDMVGALDAEREQPVDKVGEMRPALRAFTRAEG